MSTIKILLTFLLSVFIFTLSAQNIKTIKVKRATDTIVYSCLINTDFILKKVTEKGAERPYNCYKESRFCVADWYWDSTLVKRGDSLAFINWYQLENSQCLNSDHHVAIWKIRLNKQSNTLLVRKTWSITKKPSVDVNDPDHLQFKIIKSTCSELILEDIPITPKHRRYYFSRKLEPAKRVESPE